MKPACYMRRLRAPSGRKAALLVTACLSWCALGAYGIANAQSTSAAVGTVTVVAHGGNHTALDRRTYQIGKDFQAAAGTAADVLANIPSVAVDQEGNPSLRGDANVTIFIDGHPAPVSSGLSRGAVLQQIPAANIQSIEVMTSPSAQYSAEGTGGIINIVTKKPKDAGLAATTSAAVGSQGRFTLANTTSFSHAGLRASLALGLRSDLKERSSRLSTAEAQSGSEPTVAVESEEERTRKTTPSMRGEIQDQLDGKTSINAYGSFAETRGHLSQSTLRSEWLGVAPPDMSVTALQETEIETSATAGIGFSRKFGRGWEARGAFDHSLVDDAKGDAFGGAIDPSSATLRYDDRTSKQVVTADLVRADAGAKLSFGGRAEWDSYDDLGPSQYVGATIGADPLATFIYHQQVQSLYGQYERSLSSWSLQAGLRLERSNHTASGTVAGSQSNGEEAGFYPSLHLSRAIGHAKMTLAVSRRISRPDPDSLNPIANQQDPYNVVAGDARLKPQHAWIAEAGLEGDVAGISYSGALFGKQIQDAFADLASADAGDAVIYTKTNLAHASAAGVDVSASGRLGPRLGYQFSAEWLDIAFAATAFSQPRSLSGLGAKGSVDFRIEDSDMMQVQFVRQAPRPLPQGFAYPSYQLNLGFKHKISATESLFMTASDVFDSRVNHFELQGSDFAIDASRRLKGPVVIFGVQKRFGGKAGKDKDFDYE